MKVLIIGSGAREHALCWKISQSPKVEKIYILSGNGGTGELAEKVDVDLKDFGALSNFVKQKGIDLTIIGPEAPLVDGIVDFFKNEGLKIFGPTKEAARLEGSKVFTKEFCKRHSIPTADFKIFDDPQKAKDYIETLNESPVIKADGLAAGKGVIVAKDKEEAKKAIDRIMIDKEFGQAGNKVIIEERLLGEEASILVLSDGKNIMPLASSQDHKRIYDGDKGPNTGGMGAYSPAPLITDALYKEIISKVVRPAILGMEKEGHPYKGVLYAGLMITEGGPKLLEFNVRFGDPETQVILPRLKGDLIEAIEAAIDGRLDKIELKWDRRACACVVVSSGGYPGEYEKGKEISGLDRIKALEDVFVFHAGTRREDNKIFTAGGRVLSVCGLGDDVKGAVDKAYEAVKLISFDNMYYRKDIGEKALNLIK